MVIHIGSVLPLLERMLPPYPAGFSIHILLPSMALHIPPLTSVRGSESSLFSYLYHKGQKTFHDVRTPFSLQREGGKVTPE